MNENLLNIEIIKEYIAKRKIDWTKHCLNRLNQRDILISDVKTAVNNGKIIARAHNVKEQKQDTTRHAEIIAIQKASKKLNNWRLTNCEMYVTLEPCSMCAGALIQSRIKKVYIGTMDEKTGACGSVLNLLENFTFNHKVEIQTGILQKECEELLKKFFKELRRIKK